MQAWQQDRKGRARFLLQIASVFVLVLLGWLVHPDQVFERTWDREPEAEEAIRDFGRQKFDTYGEKVPAAPEAIQVRMRALNALRLRAARLDKGATNLRYTQGQAYGLQ